MKTVKLIGLSVFSLAVFVFTLGTSASAQNVTVNPGAGSYATLQAAFDAINAGTHQGAVTVEIVGNTTETATASLNASGTGSANYTSVVITPSGGARTISGSLTGAIIKLNGADNVTIDGRIGGTGRNLTVSNASVVAASAAIWISSTGVGAGATNNVIRNLEVAGGVTNTNAVATFGIIVSGTAISVTSNGSDNDNNQIIFNRVIRARYGIVTRGEGATNLNQGTVINDNIVGPDAFGPDQIGKVGILAQFENGCNISRNTVQFVGGLLATTTAGADRVGIGLGGESWAATTTNTTNTGFVVTRNRINNIVEERTFSSVGIIGSSTNGTDPTGNLIANNMISGVRANGTAGDHGLGIGLGGGNGDTVVFNSINLFGDIDPVGTTVSTVSSSGFRILAAPTNVTAKNNVVSVDFSSDTASLRHYAVVAPSAAFAWGTGGSDHNVYFINSTNAQMALGGLGTATPFTVVPDLTAWRTTFTPNQDTNSRFGNPGFVSSTDLHISPSTPTPVSDAGISIPAVTDDFDGDVRTGTPDIGADEGTFTPQSTNDVAASGISVPAPSSTLRTGDVITPQAVFFNAGTATQTNVSVRFTINGPGFVYSNDQVIASILSGGSTTVSFAAAPVLTSTGSYTTTATVLTADENSSNDSTAAGFSVVEAGPFVVNTTADTQDAVPGNGICADAGGQCSFRAAVTEANAFPGADIITLPAGTYTQSLVAANEDLNVGGDWDITSVVTVNGADEATTILQAAASAGTATERVLNVRVGGSLTLNNATVRNGRFSGTMGTATRGAGIENNQTLILNNVTVRDNQLSSTSGNSIGAGINNAGPVLTLNNTTVTANSNLRVTGGSAFGGGITSLTASTLTIVNSSISGNSATTTSTAAAFGFGAGLYLENVFVVNATNSHFDNNIGTGVLTGGGSNGSGVRALSSVGAAAFNATNCTFNGNTGTGGTSNQGVGIQLFTVNAAGTLTATLNNVSINGNTGNNLGVGLNATVTGGNLNLSISNSTVSNNTGAINGGGIFLDNTGGSASSTATANVVNSTISGNSATGNGGGFGVQQPVAGAIVTNFNYSTIANNTADSENAGGGSGGGISVVSGTVNLKNSIVADNSVGSTGAAPDISGAVTSQDYNHIENLTGATIGGTTTNNSTGDPLLGALANNGGPTLTHLPGAGSLVLNAIPNGTSDCGTVILVDQRGLPRPAGGGCDKGSVEVAAAVAFASISGRVTTAGGRPIANSYLVLTGNSLATPVVTRSSTFGFFSIPNIQTGATYTLTISGTKIYTFANPSIVINLNSDVTNANFVASP